MNRALEQFRRNTAPLAQCLSDIQAQISLSESIIPHFSETQLNLQKILEFTPLENLQKNMQQAIQSAQIVKDFEERFRLPLQDELSRIEEILTPNWSPLALETINKIAADFELIRQPWIDTENFARSIAGFAELHALGDAFRTMEPFSAKLTSVLREDLGDWRHITSFPENIYDDPMVRSDFYENLGMNKALTAFPWGTFNHLVDVSQFRLPTMPPRIKAYTTGQQDEGKDVDPDLHRNKEAYTLLLNFETQIRHFIDKEMTRAFGTSWTKHRVHGNLTKEWKEKREKAQDNGEEASPLIAYSDFGDYIQIIIRNDNWQDVFKPLFKNKESVKESFRRLHPIRICTMHSRIITPDDELFLLAETRRILKAIKKKT